MNNYQPSKISSVNMFISPETATEMLASNTNNRHMNHKLVSKYAEAMSRGRWLDTGEAIKFSEDGTLLDGQHRLAACVRSGVSVRMLVVSGIERPAQVVMDSGASRSLAQRTGLAYTSRGAPLKFVTNTVAAARIILAYESGKLFREPLSYYGTHAEYAIDDVIDAIDEHRGLADMATNVGNARGMRPFVPQGVGTACFYIMSLVNPGLASHLLDQINTGEMMAATSPAMIYRNRMLQDKSKDGLKFTALQKMYFLTRTWRAVMEDHPVKLTLRGNYLSPIVGASPEFVIAARQ